MSILPPASRGQLDTRAARGVARLKNAESVRLEVEAERHAVEERTAKLRAMRLARENSTF